MKFNYSKAAFILSLINLILLMCVCWWFYGIHHEIYEHINHLTDAAKYHDSQIANVIWAANGAGES